MASPRIMTRSRKRGRGDSGSESSEDITDKYINDILKNKQMLDDFCAISGSTDISSRGTQYEKVTKQIEEYTWVQCDNADCQKWRQIPKNVADELTDDSQWYCYMNVDTQYNDCTKPEEDYTAYDKLAKKLGYKYVLSHLTEGTLVWAKMHGYCRWPGIVTKDPITEYYIDVDFDNNPTHYHIEYLGKKHSHAWISASNVTLYGHKKDTPKKVEKSKTKYAKRGPKGRRKSVALMSSKMEKKKYGKIMVDDAIDEAETLMTLSVEQRLGLIQFIVKPNKATAMCGIQIKSEPQDDYDFGASENAKVREAYKLSLTKTPDNLKRKKPVEKATDVTKKGSKVKQTKVVKTVNQIPKPEGLKHKKMVSNASLYYSKNVSKNHFKPVIKGSNSSAMGSLKPEVPDIMMEGTLVLAKLDGYDKWPAIISRDPHTGLHCEINYNNQPASYHVEFLGPSHSHAWIKGDKICFYSIGSMMSSQSSEKCHHRNKSKKTLTSPKSVPSKSLCNKLEKAKDEAESMVKMSEQERLLQCKYRYTENQESLSDQQYRDSGFESWNYPPSSACSAASSAEQFECSKLNYNSSLVDKSKEERFKIDVEMYKKNEKAFIHDLSRFMKRNNISVNLMANWHHVQIGAFQLFLAVHERGGFQQVTKHRMWGSVYREVTETQFTAGPAPKKFYLRNIYPYELYITGGDYETEIKKIQSKNKKKCNADVMIEDETGSFTNVDGEEESEDELTAILEDLEEYSSLCQLEEGKLYKLTAILEDLEEYSSRCQLEEDIEAEKKRMGINIAFHDDSPYNKVSPGIKVFSTPSEFNSPRGQVKRQQVVPASMFSVSSGESENELVFHQMQRIVENDLL